MRWERTTNWVAALLAALGLFALLGAAYGTATNDAVVSGIVIDAEGPVAGAIVRQQTTTNYTVSASDGTFTLGNLPTAVTVTVTAWDEGYYPGGVPLVAPRAGVTISLNRYPTSDNPDHQWYTSYADPDAAIGCGHCMVATGQWEHNAHARAATNPRFFSLYNGTNVSGTRTIAPGYQLDFPGTSGNCATCHAPGAAADAPFSTNMNAVSGVAQQGVFCDFCHKIGDTYLDPATGLPYANAPGVISYRLYRPPTSTHMFFGPFDDVVRRVSYLQLEKQSQFCAPCHQFGFWGTPIYESFREWLESPYPDAGIECQSCHMAPTGVDYFVFPEQGGLIRPPSLIASHLQPGAADEELLQNTVEMRLEAREIGQRLWATVTITNTGAGHHVPTDFPGRQLLLTLEVEDEQGRPLEQLAGPSVPAWGGDQAGRPGKGFAKILQDAVSGEAPVVSYWKQVFIRSDNRIPALARDRSSYAFALPATGSSVTIRAELLFRRNFQSVMESKGWTDPDIPMEAAELSLTVLPRPNLLLPLIRR